MTLPCLRLPAYTSIPQLKVFSDSAYQGIKEYHDNSYVPKKKPKNEELSPLEKDYNRELAKERIGIISRKSPSQDFQNLCAHVTVIVVNAMENDCNLLAAIYNYELDLAS